MGNALSVDVQRDMLPALREWWQAVRELPGNPVYLLGTRRAGKKRASVLSIVSWAALFIALLVLGYFVVPGLYHMLHPAQYPGVIWGLAAIGWLLCWMAAGLFDAAVFALSIMANRRKVQEAELELDAEMLTAPLSEREITVALVALTLPRIWTRWAVAPFAALGVWVLLGLLANPDATPLATTQILQRFPAPSLIDLRGYLPFSYLVMQLFGLVASVIFVLWLLALGRGLTQTWHLYLMAASTTLVQLAWIPASGIVFANWLSNRVDPQATDPTMVRIFGMLTVLLCVVASLHFARRSPALRILFAGILPPVLLVLGLIGILRLDIYATQARIVYGEFYWAFSSLTLANPLSLSLGSLLGFSRFEHAYPLFAAWRMPVLLLLQLALLAICAHGARLAVEDWRREEA